MVLPSQPISVLVIVLSRLYTMHCEGSAFSLHRIPLF